MVGGKWRRVRRGHLCPVCGHDSWCTVSEDGQVVKCMRVQSDRKVVSRNGTIGYLHAVDGLTALPPVTPDPPKIDAPAIQRRCRADCTHGRVRMMSASLGVSEESLLRLGMGFHVDLSCVTFPMFNGKREVIGIRTRNRHGQKMAVRGSRNGLFIPLDLKLAGPLLVVEGPTDTAALLDLGFDAIGRPDCQGGIDHLLELLRGHRARPLIVVVSDNDKPGIEGANKLAGALIRNGYRATVIAPPKGIKDARQWVNRGAKREHVERAIADSGLMSQTVSRTDLTAKKTVELNRSGSGQARRANVGTSSTPCGLCRVPTNPGNVEP